MYILCNLYRLDLRSSKSCIFSPVPVQCSNLLVRSTKTVSTVPPTSNAADDPKSVKKSRERQKLLKLKCGILEHDISIKISRLLEWLEKGNRVSVLILKTARKPEVSVL